MKRIGKLKKYIQIFVLLLLLISAFFLEKYLKFKADVNPIVSPTIISPVDNMRYVYINNPLIQGTATIGSNLDIILDNETVSTVSTDENGHFYFKPSSFSDGAHSLKVVDKMNNLSAPIHHFSFDTSDRQKAILKAKGTQIFENDHPFYGNGTNYWHSYLKMMGNSSEQKAIEDSFTRAEKAGIKMMRVTLSMLDDMKLPDPTAAPAVLVQNGGALAEGSYIYRYSCINLSKARFDYKTAETLPGPSSEVIAVAAGQKTTLSLTPCAQSYRYLIYRRSATDPEGSESLLGFAEASAGQTATFTDDGSYAPSDNIPDPVSAPVLTAEPASKPSEALPAGTYLYRYTKHTARKPDDGRWETLAAGGQTLAGPTAEITVDGTTMVKATIQEANQGTWLSLYRRLSTDPVDSEKNILSPRASAGNTIVYDKNSTASSTAIPASNTTVKVSPADVNNTMNNPRRTWPTVTTTAFMTGWGNWNDPAFVALDKTIALAKEHNIRLLITLLDQHDQHLGGARDIARNAAVCNSCFFGDPTAKAMTKEVMDKFLTRTNSITGVPYKNDPAIFGWSFMNEAYDTGSGTQFRGWVNEMGTYLKSIDPNHMLASGDDGSVWYTHNAEPAFNMNNNHDFVTMGNLDVVDFMTWHGYPESAGYEFNHGLYGEYQPDAEWLAKWGPVKGPISEEGAIKELERHAHYATLLNKPVIFGEWGVDWDKDTDSSWITSLSDAIINSKPEFARGPNVFPNIHSLDQAWTIDGSSAYLAEDSSGGEPVLKLTPRLKADGTVYTARVLSKRFSVKPGQSYWFDFSAMNPTGRTFQIKLDSYYQDGTKKGTYGWGFGNDFKSNSIFVRQNRFDIGLCEVTIPNDVNELDIAINIFNATPTDYALIKDIKIYELIDPPADANSTFSATGWWSWPDKGTDLAAPNHIYALAEAQKKFDQKSISGLPPVYQKGMPPAPALLNSRKITYKDKIDLEIKKSDNINKILINDSAEGVSLLETSWKKTVNLSLGKNSIKVTAFDSDDQSTDIYFTITRQKLADYNNDNKIDVRDFSSILANWGKEITSANEASDFNEDQKVNIKDFSVLMANWGK